MTERKAPMAIVGSNLNYEKLNKDKTKVLSVKDYVTIDNLWLDPAKAAAMVARLDKDPKGFRNDLAMAVDACHHAKTARESKPAKAAKAATTAIPALPPDTLALFQQFMAMLTAQSATTAQQAGTEAAAVVNETEPDEPKRESAKERADRLREQSDKEARDRLRERSE